MNDLTKQIYDYLIEIEENSTARFLCSHCSVENSHVDTLFELESGDQTNMFDVGVFVVPKIYKELEKYKKELGVLEKAINENAQGDCVCIRRIDWLPMTRRTNEFSDRTVEYLRGVITGDSGKTNYLSGPKLVDFFNKFGFEDLYEEGFPARWKYVDEKLKELNSQGRIRLVIEDYFNPINFIENPSKLKSLIEEFNRYLKFDNLSVVVTSKKCIVSGDEANVSSFVLEKIDHEFIRENIEKCDNKIMEGDYSGAITNARSLVETLLIYIKSEISREDYKFNGDLNSLYKDISRDLNLSIGKNTKIEDSFKKIISGFFSIISGITELGNDLGDRHGKSKKTYRIKKRHALLVVNAAKIFCEFIFSSFDEKDKNSF